MCNHEGKAAQKALNGGNDKESKGTYPLVKVSGEYDPDRCECMMTNKTAGGEIACPWKAIPGSKRCPIHDKGKTAREARKRAAFAYRLGTHQSRQSALTNHENISSLREEIGVIRLLVQSYLEMGQQNNDVLLYSSSVSRLVKLLSQLAESSASMELGLENLISQNNAYSLISTVCEATNNHPGVVQDTANILQQLAPAPHGAGAGASMLNLGKWNKDVQAFVTGERVICLRNEVGVMRIYIEETFARCATVQDLVINAAQLEDYVRQTMSLLTTMHRLEKMADLLLDEEATKALTTALLDIVLKHITDPNEIERVHASLATAFGAADAPESPAA